MRNLADEGENVRRDDVEVLGELGAVAGEVGLGRRGPDVPQVGLHVVARGHRRRVVELGDLDVDEARLGHGGLPGLRRGHGDLRTAGVVLEVGGEAVLEGLALRDGGERVDDGLAAALAQDALCA